MRTDRLIVAALIAVAAPSARAEGCDVQVLGTLRPVAIQVEPFAADAQTGSTEIRLRAAMPGALDLRLRPIATDAAPPIAVELEPAASDAPIRRISVDTYRLDMPEGEEALFRFTVRAQATDVPAPGRYRLSYAVDAIDPASGMACLQESTLPVEIDVPSRAQMNLAGASGGFGAGASTYMIDFGSLRPGLSRQLAIQFRANSDARLTFRSEHGGRLVHERLPGYFIPYEAWVDGRRIALEGGGLFDLPPAPTLAGAALPIDLRIGEFGAMPPGRFSDTVTITIDAL